MLKQRFKLGGGAGCPEMSPCLSRFVPNFSSYLVTCLASCTAAVIMGTRLLPLVRLIESIKELPQVMVRLYIIIA
jgi:hypothetical protein